MSIVREPQLVKPNPARRQPLHCPYCASEDLAPDPADDFAWVCGECSRITAITYLGHYPVAAAPAQSTSSALHRSLAAKQLLQEN